MSKTYFYQCAYAPYINSFLDEKRALGCKYEKEAKIFWEFDRFLLNQGDQPALSKDIIEKWIEKRRNEKRKNQRYRLNFTKRFVSYLLLNGQEAYFPEFTISSRDDAEFVPYIFSDREIENILNYFETMQPSRNYPNGNRVFPLLFRTLACCGLRAGEAANLHVKDVDLANGILTIREAKHNKTRLVPLSAELWERYIQYGEEMRFEDSDAFFFPNARGKSHHTNVIYDCFRESLWACGIQHGGRGHGPRVHDLRHTFAVRSMQKIEKETGDILLSLPYLSAYLGHYNMNKTQYYLHLVTEVYPELIRKQCEYLGETIPTWEVDYEN
jgi:integrase/recombinase XerD